MTDFPWRDPGAEIRCVAPTRDGRVCGGMVTRAPIGLRLRVVGIVGHTSLAEPGHAVYACKVCNHWNELAWEAVAVELREAA